MCCTMQAFSMSFWSCGLTVSVTSRSEQARCNVLLSRRTYLRWGNRHTGTVARRTLQAERNDMSDICHSSTSTKGKGIMFARCNLYEHSDGVQVGQPGFICAESRFLFVTTQSRSATRSTQPPSDRSVRLTTYLLSRHRLRGHLPPLPYTPKVAAEWWILLPRVRETPDSILSPETGHPNWECSWLAQNHRVNAGIVS